MKCQVCGKEIERSSYSNGIICSSECFDKNFWNEIVSEKDSHLIINGKCYSVGPETDAYKGFGGAKQIIKKFDGTIITTTNLWMQGFIPEEYRDQLADNAVFLKSY